MVVTDSLSITNKKLNMRLKALFALFTFQSASTLVEHLSQGQIILEASVVSAFCVLGFTVGLFVLKKDFKKLDVSRGIVLGVFMGFMSQLAIYFIPDKSAIIVIGCIVVCVFPNHIEHIFLRVIGKNPSNSTKT